MKILLITLVSISCFSSNNLFAKDVVDEKGWSCSPCECTVHTNFKTEHCTYSVIFENELMAKLTFSDNYGNDLGACLAHRANNPICKETDSQLDF